MRTLLTALAMLFFLLLGNAHAQVDKMNFRDRQAVVINNAASWFQLNDFHFENQYQDHRIRLVTSLGWKNVSQKPITAAEVVILKYDPFNRPILGGGRWFITGHNSGDWTPLLPGQASSDGLIGFNDEPVLTSVVYVRAIRFQDGSVWSANTGDVEKQIRERLPILKDLGNISPSTSESKKN